MGGRISSFHSAGDRSSYFLKLSLIGLLNNFIEIENQQHVRRVAGTRWQTEPGPERAPELE